MKNIFWYIYYFFVESFIWLVDRFGFRAVAFTLGVILGLVIAKFIW